MPVARIAALVAILAVAVACSTPEPVATDDPTVDELPEDLEGLEDLLGPELEPVEPDADGNLRAQGVVVPIPEGWDVDPGALGSGLVLAVPPGSDGLPALVAAAGVEVNPFLGFQGLDYDGALAILRDLDPAGEATRDQEVAVAGAERAHLLVFEDLHTPTADGQPQLPDTDQLVILAEDADQRLAIFNYSTVAGAYEEAVEALLLTEAGFDPDSDPDLPELPEPPGDDG